MENNENNEHREYRLKNARQIALNVSKNKELNKLIDKSTGNLGIRDRLGNLIISIPAEEIIHYAKELRGNIHTKSIIIIPYDEVVYSDTFKFDETSERDLKEY